MIQFNLLPDVKKQYIQAKRTKRLIFSISSMAMIIAVVVTFLLFSIVQVAQKKSISDLTKDIESGISDLKEVENLDKILTIQNQLDVLPGLHESKPESSRLFTFLTQLTPSDVKIIKAEISFIDNTIKIEGNAPSLASVNRYTDTLKFAKYTANAKNSESDSAEAAVETPSFSDVTTELSRNEDQSTYIIRAVFDPLMFDNTKDVVLIIPNTVTTRSTQGKPTISNSDENPLFETDGGQN